MISIENFYWVIYENLLKPCGIDCWYYYPFGTTNYLSHQFEFGVGIRKHAHHALFHFDQEPLYTYNLGELYDRLPVTWSNKHIKILCNSEYSELKKEICSLRGMEDWYFFYHGFAALSWYRDSQYIVDQKAINNIFLSFSHLVKDYRSYRISMLARLIDRDILQHGSVSFHGTVQDCEEELNNPNTRLSENSRNLINKIMNNQIQLPLYIDCSTLNGTASAHFGHREYEIWQKSFLHIVNETVFYDQKLHLTEKIFKPIVSTRPFVLVAAPGNLAYLKSYGFKTFNDWWDESYDTIQNDDARQDAIIKIVNDLCSRSMREINEILMDMQDVLQFNKKHFFTDFRKIIIDELVDNFDACVKIWNNGRMDGKDLPMNLDFESIKKILLG